MIKRAQDLFRRSPFATGLVFSIVTTFVLYPGLCLFVQTPMVQQSWELKDGAVSFGVFIPGVRILRYELLHHGNILWSSLRSMGTPILGEVQAAPLFPLTLALLGAPDSIFWNCFAILRLILIGLGAYMVAYEVLEFRRSSAAIFTLCFGFGLYHLRFMNHAFLTGIMVGLWYIYALAKLGERSFGWRRFWPIVGVCGATYGMITCGFPEGAAMLAFITAMLIPAVYCRLYRARALRVRRVLLDLLLAHVIGLCLSSAQILALVEFAGQTQPDDWRLYRGVVQHDSGLWPFLLGKLTSLSPDLPPKPNPHIIGLTGSFLIVMGIWELFRRPRTARTGDGVALLAGAFFILKVFPLWPWFNHFVGSLPFLRMLIYTEYFFPALLWCLAHFAARGFEAVADLVSRPRTARSPWGLVGCVTVALVIVWLVNRASYVFQETSWIELVFREPTSAALFVIFLGFLALLLVRLALDLPDRAALSPRWRVSFSTSVVGAIALELLVAHPNRFSWASDYEKIYGSEDTSRVLALEDQHGLRARDYRLRNEDFALNVKYLPAIATPDTGYPPIIPERLRLLRVSLFDDAWRDGYSPFKLAKFSYSWRLISTGLFIARGDERHADPAGTSGAITLGAVEQDAVLFADPNALSRAYVASRCFSAQSIEQARVGLTTPATFHLGDSYLEGLGPSERSLCETYHHSIDAVRILADEGSSLVLDRVAGPAVLILNDNHYPGWSAMDVLSGQRLKIHHANMTFRGLVLPDARDYQIRFDYLPPWLRWAELLTGVGIVLITLLAWLARKRARLRLLSLRSSRGCDPSGQCA